MTEKSTLFAADSLVSPLVSPGSAEARMMTVTSGQKCLPLLKSTSPLGSLVKMLLASKVWRSQIVKLSWKAELLPETRTTITTNQYTHDKKQCFSIRSAKTLNQSVTMSSRLLFQLVPSTPRTDAPAAGFWATPTVSRGNNCGTGDLKLPGQVKLWPTPTASIAKGTSQAALVRKDGKSRAADRLDHSILASGAVGSLNPDWVEALMGFPVGWTDLSAKDGNPESPEQHQAGS